MTTKSSFLATATINGKDVSFFSPPHSEPDFLWVDVEELANAFLAPDAARLMLDHAHNFDRYNRPVATAANGDRISTIMCHTMAQAMCGAIDQVLTRYVKEDDEWGGGPCETAYCVAAGLMMHQHGTLPFELLGKAFHNQGGPFMRSLREE